jgi:hypothetical protein
VYNHSTISVENSMKPSQKTKNKTAIWSRNTTPSEGLKDGLQKVPKGDKWWKRHFSLGNAHLHLKGIATIRQCKNRL